MSDHHAKATGRTDAGLRRANNEDSLLVLIEEGIFVVADGVGGRAHGEVASQLCVQTFDEERAALTKALDAYAKAPAWGTRNHALEVLNGLCQRASGRVFEEGKRRQAEGMTTTLVVCALRHGMAFLAHVGDSRILLSREGELRQLTEDHSMVNQLIARGQMDPSHAQSSPYRNVITRAIGLYPTVQADLMALELVDGDRLLLCSDGLSDVVSPDTIQEIMGPNETDKAADLLIQAAHSGGAPDNVTAIVVDPPSTGNDEATRARAEAIRDFFLFVDLPFHTRLRMSRVCRARVFSKGEALITEGDPGSSMFLLTQGRARVSHGKVKLATLCAGEHFGELGLLDDQPRSATVTALEAGALLEISREALLEFCGREPALGTQILWRLLDVLASRIRKTNERFAEDQPPSTGRS